jgi:hypothetical protein
MKLCLDLGVGLGGASAAFKDAGWDVISIDIDRRFRPTIQASYTHLPFRSGLNPNVILAAPDCRCFSVAALYRHWAKGNPPTPKSQDAKEAIKATKELVSEVRRLDPDYAVLENPRGMMRHVLGPPQHTIRQSDYGSPFKKPTDLWEFGRKRLAFAWLEFQGDWIKAPRGAKKGIQGIKHRHVKGEGGMSDYIHAPALRAKWPYGLSKAILDGLLTAEARE